MSDAELMTPLAQLTDEVNELQAEIAQAARTTLDVAARCGEKLAQIRDEVPDFKAWCSEHFVASRQTAYNWIDIHNYRDLWACQTVGHVGEVLKLISSQKKAERAEQQQETSLAEIDEMVTECTDPVDLGKVDAASGDPTPPVVEADAATKIAKIAQRLESAQAIVGAAVAEVESLEAAAEASERGWLGSLLGHLSKANDGLVDFVDAGMSGGGL